jgi:chitin disaccharide deacetylase
LRQLAINADDFGFTTDVNAGIVEAHKNGILTSTTLMANGEAFEDAVRLAKEIPSLDIGCHLVLVQGRSLVSGKPLPGGPRQLIFALAGRAIDVRSELRSQIEKILGSGLRPTHLDTHKHTHLVPTIFREVVLAAKEFHIPYVRIPLDRTLKGLRSMEPLYRRIAKRRGISLPDHFIGFRLTGFLTETTLLDTLPRIPAGFTEFMCHPGKLGEELTGAQTRLKETRVQELKALTSPRVRDRLGELNIELTSFAKARNESY